MLSRKKKWQKLVVVKTVISMSLKNDGEGTYYEIIYDDGSLDFVELDWYA
jgi:hypothetical protein